MLQGGPTSTKYVDRIGSYQWYLNDETATILVPGAPVESFYWPGGKLMQDHGVVIYDVNHMKVRDLLTETRENGRNEAIEKIVSRSARGLSTPSSSQLVF